MRPYGHRVDGVAVPGVLDAVAVDIGPDRPVLVEAHLDAEAEARAPAAFLAGGNVGESGPGVHARAGVDGAELAAGTDPLVAESTAIEPVSDGDSDGDRLLDADEAAFGTDPGIADSDGDGWFDGDEVSLGTDPLDASSFPVG